jgi:O-antigen ligase
MTRRDHSGESATQGLGACLPTSRIAFGGFWLLLFLATILVGGPWAGFHGILLGVTAVIAALSPPAFRLPRTWWLLAGFFMAAALACFLPASWFSLPDWRAQLTEFGVGTGSLVAIQSRQAAELLTLFALMLLTGMWFAGHRPTPAQLRLWAMAFSVGVAVYAILARTMQNQALAGLAVGEAHFGFFPNRNHSATYLAMGAVCGLGNTLQALRDKRFVHLGIALATTAVCLWAIAAWSISRAGVVLVAIGCLIWLPMLGRRYLGRHGIWAIALIAITAVGLFLIADTGVRERLSATVEKAGTAIQADPAGEKSALDANPHLDFRIPVFFDTLGLIRDFPWTGIGAGQFYYVFPQYRKRTVTAQDADAYHPESDWMWMASEAGVPATLALLTLVVLACRKSLKGIFTGRDRALRSACLVAAMLVPIHGIFDVPGHRITLAWSAVFLFVLSLPPPSSFSSLPVRCPSPWPSRVLALCLLATSLFLIRAQWFGGSQPAVTAAAQAISQAQKLYREDQALQQAATAQGQEHQPDPAEDRLEKALKILDAAKALAPLNREILRHEAFLAFHFDDKYDRIDRAFALDRTLDPTWVAGPLRQAEAWAAIDPQRAADLCLQALHRSENLDHIQPGNLWTSTKVRERIRQFTRQNPALESALPSDSE